MKNCFLNTVGVNIEGRRIKCIKFVDDMAWLAEDEKMLKNMLMELNDRFEEYGMKIKLVVTPQWNKPPLSLSQKCRRGSTNAVNIIIGREGKHIFCLS